VRLNLLVMQQLEAYIGGVSELFDGDHLNNAETDAFLKNFMKSFANWVAKARTPTPAT
jgi:hypothetical protein